MFNISFYETSSGFCDIHEFLEELRQKAPSPKDARIQFTQAARCIQLLQENGTNLPIEIVKYIEKGIWELRPGNNRIFFFSFCNDTYVLLHHYRKKTRKAPPREIKRAVSEKNDYLIRKEQVHELE